LVYVNAFTSLGYVQVRLESSDFIELGESTNHRYLVDGGNEPHFIVGSSHQGMMYVPLSEMEECLASRAADGVNAIIAHILLWGVYGDTTQNTYDNINPFTSSNDLSTPNETYFSRVDDMLDLCLQYNMTVFLDPYPTKDDWMGVLRTNGSTKAYNFGAYLGARYASYTNIIWTHGNDFQSWADETDSGLIRDIHDGIASEAAQWQTVWEDYDDSDSLQDSAWQDAMPNLVYAYTSQYVQTDTAYARTVSGDPVPAIFFEGHYDGEDYYTDPGRAGYRAQHWWSFLSGAIAGSFYGQNEQFRMTRVGSQPPKPAWNASGWDTRVAWLDFLIFASFVKSITWYSLIPDTTHTVLTAGYGTYDTAPLSTDQSSDYATCAYIEGSLSVIYMPSNRTMTVDMTHFSGSVTCRWFDPTDGSYTADAASPHTNTGTHDFSRATANSSGSDDWLLVLTA
jgi:hypothetical protein